MVSVITTTAPFSEAVFDNKSIVTIEHIEKAILNSRAIYPDIIKKGVEELRIQFKDLFAQEEQIRRDFLKYSDE